MMGTVASGFKCLKCLAEIEGIASKKTIFLVTGRESYRSSGASEVINDVFADKKIIKFNEFSVNPNFSDAIEGLKIAKQNNVDLIVAIGGGSVLDMAKLVRAFLSAPNDAKDLAIGKKKISEPLIPMVAVPTTAGSGSEATHFAVVYVDKQKYSLASRHLLPNVVVLDGSLVVSNSPYQKACNGLDAIAQAIESAWSVGGNERSFNFSLTALQKAQGNFTDFVAGRGDSKTAQVILEMAHSAGQAINISKTTAAHAWSYGFTSHFGIPHGHAVWLTLPKIAEIHVRRSKTENPILFEKLDRIFGALGFDIADDVCQKLRQLLSQSGVEYEFSKLNISSAERRSLSQMVNVERMANNPIVFRQEEISDIFEI